MFDHSRETSLNKPSRDKNNSVVASRISRAVVQRILRVRLLQHVHQKHDRHRDSGMSVYLSCVL